MRIITVGKRFKDYYDGGMAMGQDQSITYVRENRCIEGDFKIEHAGLKKSVVFDSPRGRVRSEFLSQPRPRWYGSSDDLKLCVLFFCGKAYPFYRGTRYVERTGIMNRGLYDPIAITSFNPKGFDQYIETSARQKQSIGEWLADNVCRSDINVNLHFKSPIVVYQPVQVEGRTIMGFEVDACLRDLGFANVIDPFTAFQEISMFISNVLVDTRDAPSPMTDKQKIASHGLHPTHAFRKTKSS